MMTPAARQGREGGAAMRRWWIGLCALVLVAGASVAVWTTTCPCDRTPGFYLTGTAAAAPVVDWQFVNDIPACQLQIDANGLPHSINVTCMATPDGGLFISCSNCEGKYWSSHVEADERARVRLNGTVYPVTLNRVREPSRLDQAWGARIAKLARQESGPGTPAPPAGTPRPDTWWSFQARSLDRSL